MLFRLLAICLIAIGSVFVSLFRLMDYNLKKKKFACVTGEINGCRQEGKKTYVSYWYAVDGRDLMGEFKSNTKKYQAEGQKIEVYYDPKNPYHHFTECQLQEQKGELLGTVIAVPILAATVAIGVYFSMPKETYKISGGPATEYTCTEKEIYISMLDSEISSHMVGSILYKNTWISLDYDEEYTDLETASGQVQYRRYYGRRYTNDQHEKYFKKVTYVAYQVTDDENLPVMMVFVDAFGAYEIAGIEDILQEEFSAEKVAEVMEGSPEENKTQLSIPEELNGIGAATAAIDSDKYIFLADASGQVKCVAEIPFPDNLGTDVEMVYVSWKENELEYCYETGNKTEDETEDKTTYLTWQLFDPEDKYSEMYFEIWDMVDNSEKDSVTTTTCDGNTYLWILEDDYIFYMTISGTEDSQLLQEIYEDVCFYEEDYQKIEAAGPQAVRKIQVEASGNTVDVYHTAGLGLWYPSELEELGIQDNYPIEMGGTDTVSSNPLYSFYYSAKILTSGNGNMEIEGHDIVYYYAGGLKYNSVLYSSGTSNKEFICKAYMDLGSLYLECSLDVKGITEMDTEELEDLITQCYEGCLNPPVKN